jgi:hypothetical protein
VPRSRSSRESARLVEGEAQAIEAAGVEARAGEGAPELDGREEVGPDDLGAELVTLRELADYLLKEKNLSVVETTRLSVAIAQWAIASSYAGHFVSISEFAEWSGESVRTVERRSSAIRRVLDEQEFRRLVDELGSGVAAGDAALRVARAS